MKRLQVLKTAVGARQIESPHRIRRIATFPRLRYTPPYLIAPVYWFRCSFFFRGTVTAAGMLTLIAPAVMARPKPTLAPVPPQPVEQTLRVRRGESVDVPLRIYGTRAQTLEFRIRAAPRAGTLSPIRQIAPERAMVTYTPPVDQKIATDQFSYAVRSNEGVSAAAQIVIQIADDPAKLVVPSELSFAPTVVGSDASAELAISNEGGAVAEGTMAIDPPWTVEGLPGYRLAPGERRGVRIAFRPEHAGTFGGEVRFSSDPLHATSLRGIAHPSITFQPLTVEMQGAPGDALRKGEFVVTNHSSAAVDLVFAGSERLQLPRTLQLAPCESRRVEVALADDDATAFSGDIRVDGHGTIAVRSDALPARFVVKERTLRLASSSDGSARGTLAIENRGGRTVDAVFEPSAPFIANPPSIRLEAAAIAHVTISTPARASSHVSRGELVVRGGENALVIALENDTRLAPAAPSAKPARARRDSPIVQVNAQVTDSRFGDASEERDELFPQRIYPRELGHGKAIIEWDAALSKAPTYRAQEQHVSLRDGNVQIEWRDFPSFQAQRKETHMVGTFTNLAPGRVYVMRVLPVFDAARPAAPLLEVRFATAAPPRHPWRTIVFRVLMVVVFVLGALAAVNRIKRA